MLELSRRSVMTLGAGAVGAIALSAVAAPAVAGAGVRADNSIPAFIPAPSSGLPVRSHFAGHEGDTFVAVTESGGVALTLVAIDDVPPVSIAGDENRFTLIFTVHGISPAPQGIVDFTHPSVPAATLFASPVGNTAKRQLQALVNRTT